jgi:hypothetical protein
LHGPLDKSYACEFSVMRINNYLKVMKEGTTIGLPLVNKEEEEPNLRNQKQINCFFI